MAAALQLPVPLAALLVQRGITTAEGARDFLRPDLTKLSDPRLLAGMNEALEVITAVTRHAGRILVHGDYDVDGQCAAAVLLRTFKAAGVDAHGFIPDRRRDGYDFGEAGLAEAERIGAELILTCDCGITALDAVAMAKKRGFRVVVTDHHLPAEQLPAADAVINPQRADDHSGLRMLAGTGVAFKLVQALLEPLGLPANFAWHLLDLVALATIADVVPLVGENRILVRHGLRLLPHSRWVGLRALLASTGVAHKEIRAGQVGFVLAPRLNAVGRLADAREGLELLLTDDEPSAIRLARRLEALNAERQSLDQAILEEALATVESRFADPEVHRAIVLDGSDWHPGVIGIVASRIVERYGRPTFLISVADGMGKGSGRSIDGFDLHAALEECHELLERYGGHRMAAGLTIAPDRIGEFRRRFNALACARLSLEQVGPEQRVDLEVEPQELDEALERLGRHLEPCGMGNPAPVFGLRRTSLLDSRAVGTNHLKARLNSPGRSLDLIAFGWADRVFGMDAEQYDVALRLELNEFQGRVSLQGRVVAIAPG